MPGFTEQLNKLPSLVNHYRHHVLEHDTASFAEFIELHYGDGSVHKTEENHQDLPLYQVSSTILLVIVQEFPSYNVEAPTAAFIEHAVFRHKLYAFNSPKGIFQPPRWVYYS